MSAEHSEIFNRLAGAMLKVIAQIPETAEPRIARPAPRAAAITNASAAKAALVAGALAVPPGPAGLLTILPEMVSVWRVQAQMVADLAALFGKSGELKHEQMLYCLFRQTTGPALRDLAAYTGEKILVSQGSAGAFQEITGKIGVHLGLQVLRRGIARWLPIVGAVGVGVYAYYDTRHVARVAIELFSRKPKSKPAAPKSIEPASAKLALPSPVPSKKPRRKMPSEGGQKATATQKTPVPRKRAQGKAKPKKDQPPA